MDREQLVNENIKLAYHFGHKWKRKAYWLDKDDLMSAALLGLYKAAQAFDETKGIKFSTFVGNVINNEVLLLMRSLRKIKDEVSMEAPTNDSGYWADKETTIADTISIEDPTEEWTTNQALLTSLNKLNEDDRNIIYLHYMQDMKQADIAAHLGISQPHVNRRLKKALHRMQCTMQA